MKKQKKKKEIHKTLMNRRQIQRRRKKRMPLEMRVISASAVQIQTIRMSIYAEFSSYTNVRKRSNGWGKRTE